MVREDESYNSEKQYMCDTPPVNFSGRDFDDGLLEDLLDLSGVKMSEDDES
jgi:hypothetical protein